ncbi:hypothetical protein MSG28_010873 [Choristoneura fumiferana]|uniref:Uncharacterized protein n=1 Tax=Choristoneura fumiferana TaxID=7141 RepID=A0ACC0KPQ1_CHOFU|nr:hypothetical protein MSG28_010873 [Choristoneura fumiferana]
MLRCDFVRFARSAGQERALPAVVLAAGDVTASQPPRGRGPRPRLAFTTSPPATLITATAGTCYGWPSPTLSYLLSDESSIPTTPDQGSWITSIMILCSALTPVPSAYFADRFGRKTTLLLGVFQRVLYLGTKLGPPFFI